MRSCLPSEPVPGVVVVVVDVVPGVVVDVTIWWKHFELSVSSVV
jgi:hypothetical protein